MSALSIAFAWGALAAAAFAALSAGALARTHDDLETASLGHGEGQASVVPTVGEDVEDLILPAAAPFARRSPRARERGRAHTHWPAPAHTNALLRSSPSVAHMSASPGRPGPIHVS